MLIEKLNLPGVKVFVPDIHRDHRGYFSETLNPHYNFNPLQANMSLSHRGVIRGLHYQAGGVSKLVWVASGAIYDVAFNRDTGEWAAVELTADNHKQLLIPATYAHGFQALEDNTVVCYLQDTPFNPFGDFGINPSIIDWPLETRIISEKDNNAPQFHL